MVVGTGLAIYMVYGKKALIPAIITILTGIGLWFWYMGILEGQYYPETTNGEYTETSALYSTTSFY